MKHHRKMTTSNHLGRQSYTSLPNPVMSYGTTSNTVTTDNDTHFPQVDWVYARHDAKKRRFPQSIAHRGYRAAYPENTLRAFQGAAEAGAHALETDIHLTKDDVVVLSHDPDLKRCFGQPEKIVNCDWHYISRLRTTQSPHETMPRLSDLLEYIAKPEQQHLWILLDIKLDNDAPKVMRLIAETVRSVDSNGRAWKDRIVLGIWSAEFLPLCASNLPGYPIAHIGLSSWYANQFVKVPNVSFNMLQKLLLASAGARLMKDIQKAGRPLFVWTVNDINMMKWSIQKEIDGVITDDPKKFKEVCDQWDDGEPPVKSTWIQWLYTFWLYILFSLLYRLRFPRPIEKHLVRSRDLRTRASLSVGA